jgi:hypothetical protein
MMEPATKELAKEVQSAVERVCGLRDEAKLKIHLASMDARAAWDRLEPKINEAERTATQALVTALHEVEATAEKLREFVASL